ncbi:Iron compound ABC transporter, permease [Bacillus mobilis]|nr:Iron compound ABC transporter, permease [Bacillus mobilis]
MYFRLLAQTKFFFSVLHIHINFNPIGAFISGLLAVGIVLFFSWKSGFSPTALALIGIGISVLSSAIMQIFIVSTNLNVAVFEAPYFLWLMSKSGKKVS